MSSLNDRRAKQLHIMRDLLSQEERLGLLNKEYFDFGTQTVNVSSVMSETAPLDLLDASQLQTALMARIWSIAFAIHNTLISSAPSVEAVVRECEMWIRTQEIVRIVGAGRALLAAAVPANRLHHAGARVYIQNSMVPLPNSSLGGAILASSASGKTKPVLELMEKARLLNDRIRIIGIADAAAEQFHGLCDISIRIESERNPYKNPLRAMADVGEYIISEVLDAIVVAAARRAGKTEDDLRGGHEDLGDTGPYQPSAEWYEAAKKSQVKQP